MSLFSCPTHGLHQGQFCPAGNEIEKCAGPSVYVTIEPPKATLEEQWSDWVRPDKAYVHGREFHEQWDMLMQDRTPPRWNFNGDDESYT